MRARVGRMLMCHMIADTEDELLKMADWIGVARRWHQKPGTSGSHFDIALSKRALAVAAGALEIRWKQTGCMVHRRRVTGFLGNPEEAEEWVRKYFQTKRAEHEEEACPP
jgi:hypothetical protein